MPDMSKLWRVNRVIDRGRDGMELCQCCQSRMVRYAHVVEADDDGEVLEVGCVCVERMIDGYDGKAAEANLRNRAARIESLQKRWYRDGDAWVRETKTHIGKVTERNGIHRATVYLRPDPASRTWVMPVAVKSGPMFTRDLAIKAAAEVMAK